MPPTRWTPTTSRESSKPRRYLRPTARAQTAPASSPSRIADQGTRKAQAGVMATRPDTAPDAAPSEVGCPSRIFSTSSQPRTAAAVATWVLVKASPARPLAARADPALKPNQPNHSRPAPSITNGRLCGLNWAFGQPLRLPSTIASARPAAPALMWTAVPPAKSSTPRAASHPAPFPSASPKLKTQCATGKYTRVAQSVTKADQPRNLARSAIAPEMSAGVMIANISWNIENAVFGIVSCAPFAASGLSASPMPAQLKPPKKPLPVGPNATEKP